MPPEPSPPPPRTPERIAVEIAVRLVLLGLFAWFAWTLVRPFLALALWSAVLTVAFYPLYEWLRNRLGRPWLAAALLTSVGVLATAGPATLLLASLVDTVESLARRMGAPPYALPRLPAAICGPMPGRAVISAGSRGSA